MGSHAFISYKRGSDNDYVANLAGWLVEAGIDVWYDHALLVGGQFDRDLQHKIATCSAFIVIMSSAAESSPWVAREIAEAEVQDRPILPLLREGRRMFRLGHLQYEDVRDGQMPGAAFVAHIRQLCGSTKTATPVKPTTAGTPRAIPYALPKPSEGAIQCHDEPSHDRRRVVPRASMGTESQPQSTPLDGIAPPPGRETGSLDPHQDLASTGKYRPLTDYLLSLHTGVRSMTFAEIEDLLGTALAPSARKHKPYWYSSQNSLGKAIAAAGFKARAVQMDAETVEFSRRPTSPIM